MHGTDTWIIDAKATLDLEVAQDADLRVAPHVGNVVTLKDDVTIEEATNDEDIHPPQATDVTASR
jgi:hypothetical protein